MNIIKLFKFLNKNKEQGNLALEQILFITAIVLLSAGVATFYDNLSSYFKTFSVGSAPTSLDGKLLVTSPLETTTGGENTI